MGRAYNPEACLPTRIDTAVLCFLWSSFESRKTDVVEFRGLFVQIGGSMAWQIAGDYFETCSCNYLCPCVPSNLAAEPTKGFCDFAMVFNVEKGKGHWSVGLIVDERASEQQKQAIVTIASGQAGGPPAILTAVVGQLLGVES